MKIFAHKNFGRYENFSYWLSSKWGSFTYIFRRPYYRLRLIKRFYKYPYYGSWELSEHLQEIAFEVFCEYYENGGKESVCWDEEPWKHAKEEMDYLYQWWMKDRHERQEEIDTVLDTWNEHHISWWIAIENGYSRYECQSSRYAKYLSKLYDELEQKFEKEKEENFIRLVKIRGYFWT